MQCHFVRRIIGLDSLRAPRRSGPTDRSGRTIASTCDGSAQLGCGQPLPRDQHRRQLQVQRMLRQILRSVPALKLRVAMDILSILQRDPDRAVEIQHDKLASAFVRQIGIADAFAVSKTLGKAPTVQIRGFDGIRSHFVLVFLFSGCTPAKENGYLVTCAPRSGFAEGLSTADFVASASREPRLTGLRVVIRTPPNLN